MGLSDLLNGIRRLSLDDVSYSWTDAREESEHKTTDTSTLFDNQQPESTSHCEISSSSSSSSSFNKAEDDRQTADQTSKDESADCSNQTASRKDVYYTLIQKPICQKTPLSQLVVLKSATQQAKIRRTLRDGGNEGDWYDATCQEIWISMHIHQITWADPFTLCIRS